MTALVVAPNFGQDFLRLFPSHVRLNRWIVRRRAPWSHLKCVGWLRFPKPGASITIMNGAPRDEEAVYRLRPRGDRHAHCQQEIAEVDNPP